MKSLQKQRTKAQRTGQPERLALLLTAPAALSMAPSAQPPLTGGRFARVWQHLSAQKPPGSAVLPVPWVVPHLQKFTTTLPGLTDVPGLPAMPCLLNAQLSCEPALCEAAGGLGWASAVTKPPCSQLAGFNPSQKAACTFAGT